ncbi:MAG: hypothetical protein TECD_00426 [Hyphomicrobiaceae bacterium hypho_1]
MDLSKRCSNWGHSLSDYLEVSNYISAWTSLPAGVVTLTENFDGNVSNYVVFQEMVHHVQELMEAFEAKCQLRQHISN